MNPCLRLLACSALLWSATAGAAAAQQFINPQTPLSPQHYDAQQAAYAQQMQQMQAQQAAYMQQQGQQPGGVQPAAYQQTGNPSFLDGSTGVDIVGGPSGQGFGDGAVGGIMTTIMNPTWMGNIWGNISGANKGLGYESSYVTLGAKRRLLEDDLAGRWLIEARGHMNIDTGGFFTNVGIERVMTIEQAKTDVSLGFWYDGDFDELEGYGHSFNQVGPTFKLKTRNWQFWVNGYIPVGEHSNLIGLPGSPFFQNFILERNGYDVAYKGFDATVQLPLPNLAMLQTSIDLGGYYYAHDAGVTDNFGGFRARLNATTLSGLGLSLELTQDSIFGTTLVGQVSAQLGANDNYDPLGDDLAPTRRNDHIVRRNQEAIFLIDPDTNLPYRILHVNNTRGIGGDGTFENPFSSLEEAEGASIADDVVFVHQGDGTTNNLDTGIVLKDRQFLLGDGIVHTIPSTRGPFRFALTENGGQPAITNQVGPAVTLANTNTVRNFNILDAQTAIFGDGAPPVGTPAAGGVTTLDTLTINGVGDSAVISNGIVLNNMPAGITNAVRATNIQINETEGIAIDFQGGAPNFTFLGSITNTTLNSQQLIRATGQTGASNIVFGGGNFTDTGGRGILLQNFNGNFTLNNQVTLTDSVADAISVIGGTAADVVNLANVTVTGGTMGGVNINNVDGIVNFGIANIVDPTGTAFRVNGNAAVSTTVNFNGNISKSNDGRLLQITSLGGGSDLDFVSGTLTATGANGTGILIDQSLAGAASTIDIEDADLGGVANRIRSGATITNNAANHTITFNALDAATQAITPGDRALTMTNNEATVVITNGSLNTNGDEVARITNNNSAANNVNFASTVVNSTTTAGLVVQQNTGGVGAVFNLGVVNATVIADTGVDIQDNTSSINIATGSIVNQNGGPRAINIRNTQGVMTFSAVNAAAGVLPAIDVQNLLAGSVVRVQGGTLTNRFTGVNILNDGAAATYEISGMTINTNVANSTGVNLNGAGGDGSTLIIAGNTVNLTGAADVAATDGTGFDLNAGDGTFVTSTGNIVTAPAGNGDTVNGAAGTYVGNIVINGFNFN